MGHAESVVLSVIVGRPSLLAGGQLTPSRQPRMCAVMNRLHPSNALSSPPPIGGGPIERHGGSQSWRVCIHDAGKSGEVITYCGGHRLSLR